ncbi:Putative short-chain dehydrogenase/reductase SDR, NAD(P)-binding domain superfamily [Colletotrichum destructivum]|uniref:Short-chain dehydrogenase/reductase SDR, NAD(P)-binding domain superfamily n=1 Tax=Colletotrichum destructivum TaxID=34406 RepID=A0AAX4J133_9PEZI|nr:Putative short-chain dehydrogenase/reductase SDR, NAD(P)-binding domain superfamily [Colletotrichum destructivum]
MDAQKIILVTGANTGFGSDVVKSLLQSTTFYSILFGSRNLANADNAIQCLAAQFPASESVLYPLQVDIENDESINVGFRTVEEKFGRLDALVNNAGMLNPVMLKICSFKFSKGGQFDQLAKEGKMTLREVWNKTGNFNTTGTHIMTSFFAPKHWSETGVRTWGISPSYLATGLGGSLEINKKQGAQNPAIMTWLDTGREFGSVSGGSIGCSSGCHRVGIATLELMCWVPMPRVAKVFGRHRWNSLGTRWQGRIDTTFVVDLDVC